MGGKILGRQNRIILKTLGHILGISPVTVSKALRDRHDVASATKENVKKLADELGYHPNIMARSLVQQCSYMIGVIIPAVTTSFFSTLIRLLSKYNFPLQFKHISYATFFTTSYAIFCTKGIISKKISHKINCIIY